MSDPPRRQQETRADARTPDRRNAQEQEDQPTLVVDFDGTIAEWASGGFPAIGEPVEGARYFLQLLKGEGWKIIVYSCRCGPQLEAEMAEWLQQHDIPYDEINRNSAYPWASGKPVGDIYLDDRGIQFLGNWQEAYQRVQEFKHLRGGTRLAQHPSLGTDNEA